MKDSKLFQEKLRDLLRTNPPAILVEIALVFAPLYIFLIVSDRLGENDFVSLGGELLLAGGPLIYVGMLLTLAVFWVVSKIRGSVWADFGLARPKSWGRTILLGLGVSVAFMVAATLVMMLLKLAFPNTQADLRRFDFLHGDLPNLIINVVALWFSAGFLEEFLWRGYLMNRLVDLQGKETWLTWTLALVGSAIIFGLGHTYQGLGGVIKITAMGLLLGAAFLAVRRNLWPMIIAHAVIDTISMVQHYFGS
jgi:membrane protease YdiL (CAAX protease family)